jgi:hypothetical protein
VITLLNPERLRWILTKMLDENEFLGPQALLGEDHQPVRARLSAEPAVLR